MIGPRLSFRFANKQPTELRGFEEGSVTLDGTGLEQCHEHILSTPASVRFAVENRLRPKGKSCTKVGQTWTAKGQVGIQGGILSYWRKLAAARQKCHDDVELVAACLC